MLTTSRLLTSAFYPEEALMKTQLPSPEMLRKLLRYDPDTGRLYWRERAPELFTAARYSKARICAIWNTRFAGKEALATDDRHGYRFGRIFALHIAAHRAVWAMHNGTWPPEDVDHVNGVRSDNRLVNLRAVSRYENTRNAQIRRDNKSGTTGVLWDKQHKKWRATIKDTTGTRVCLGVHRVKEDAIAARKSAERRFGYHENHGRPGPISPVE